jgi:small subunit ribosomal protein S6
MLNLESDSETLNEYERIMGLNEDILRFMTVSIDEIEEGPSIMMQAKPEKSQRGRGQDDDSVNEQDKE